MIYTFTHTITMSYQSKHATDVHGTTQYAFARETPYLLGYNSQYGDEWRVVEWYQRTYTETLNDVVQLILKHHPSFDMTVISHEGWDVIETRDDIPTIQDRFDALEFE